MRKKAPQPRPRPPRRRRRQRARYWAIVLALVMGATAIVVLAVGVFLYKTVNSFDGDEVRELTAIAAALGPVLIGFFKLVEFVVTRLLAH